MPLRGAEGRHASRTPVARGGALLALLAAVGLSACGGGGAGPAVVTVGREPIYASTVEHWTRVVERGEEPGSPLERVRGTPRQRALGFLIFVDWLNGEAAARGMPVSDDAAGRVLAIREGEDGRAEFQQKLRAGGRGTADARLEVRAELADAAIHRYVAQRAAEVGQGEVRSLYLHNLPSFRRGEVRDVELIENLPSRSAAEALVKRIGTARAFSRRAYHEQVAKSSDHALRIPGKAALIAAIFAARRGVVSAPMPLNHAWTVFIVRRIAPPTLEPLAAARGEIVARLAALRLRRLTATLEREFTARWTAKTSCRRGSVVPGCAQYAGRHESGEPAPF